MNSKFWFSCYRIVLNSNFDIPIIDFNFKFWYSHYRISILNSKFWCSFNKSQFWILNFNKLTLSTKHRYIKQCFETNVKWWKIICSQTTPSASLSTECSPNRANKIFQKIIHFIYPEYDKNAEKSEVSKVYLHFQDYMLICL